MPRLKILLAIFVLFGSTLACVTIMGNSAIATETPHSPVTEEPVPTPEPSPEAVSCPLITDQIMKIAIAGSGQEEKLLDKEVYLVSYAVSGNEISSPNYETVSSGLKNEQNDASTQQQVWDYFAALIPASQRGLISEYSIMTDGQGGTLAAVTQTQSDPKLWSLEVDIADTGNTYDLTYTLVHEFGHLLTLGPGQVPPSLAVFNNPDDNNIYLKEASACPRYFPGEGCANADSYINSFYDQFWTGIHEEWNKINLEENQDVYNQRLDEFYQKYQNQFVTDYAPTNPEEDIAESWAFFVLGPKPVGDSIAEQKALFFYQYPELVALRAQILNNLCLSFPK
jgi:hypothetical protein